MADICQGPSATLWRSALTNGEQIWLSVWKSRRNQFPSITAGLGAELSSHFSSSEYTRHQAGFLSSSCSYLSLFLFAIRPNIKLLGKLACECVRDASLLSLSLAHNIIYERAALDARARLHILLMWKRRAPGEKMSIVAHTLCASSAAKGEKERWGYGIIFHCHFDILHMLSCSRMVPFLP